jgi:hypothetical protein
MDLLRTFFEELTEEELRAAMTRGWRITLRGRILSISDRAGGLHANLDTNSRRFDINVLRAFPDLLEGSNDVIARLNLVHKAANATTGAVTGPMDGGVYHTFVLAYDPDQKAASLYVDEKLHLGGYEGHTGFTNPNTLDAPLFMFGTSGAKSEFVSVKFEVLK